MKELHVSPHTLEFWVDGILYLFNPLSDALDSIQDVSKQEEWKRLRDRKTGSHELVEELSSRGYIYNDEQEEAALRARLQDLAEREASRVVRCHVILTYECNLRCVYCYEEGISRERGVIKECRVSQVQVTIDGPQSVHDRRRPRTSGRGSFAAIVRSVDEALRAELPVAVRVNVDYQNLHHAPHIAMNGVSI